MYRVIRFWRAFTARVCTDELEAITPILGPAGMSLFLRLTRSDQRHSLDVYGTLQNQGHTDSDLLVAALMHDIGKVTGTLYLPHRVVITLLQRFSPRLLEYLASNQGPAVFSAFRVASQHPQIGARLMAEAGLSSRAIELVRHHHDRTWMPESVEDSDLAQLMELLQQADGTH